MTNNDIFAALRPHILNVTGVSECILADPNGPSPDGPYASVRPRQSIRERGQANIIMTDGANDTIVYEIRAQIVASCEINFFRGEAMQYAEMLKECHKRPDVCWPLWKAGIGWGGTEPVNNLTALQASNFEQRAQIIVKLLYEAVNTVTVNNILHVPFAIGEGMDQVYFENGTLRLRYVDAEPGANYQSGEISI
ncbi:hypothetical protein [Pectobacterium phage PEAT2]|uniref:Phage neck terminator protein gp12-like domain-containing protein n=1 Tax=Pectobacterium phage PEAT2 TaxID=2053078 RepID=A0A2H4N7D8_9CAUD|nr:hypothetical protein F8206_gp41 [Pectobacterium phage PEAT2]ATV25094.1 hypothetical protein [Pectobacterium phage PEAT2]